MREGKYLSELLPSVQRIVLSQFIRNQFAVDMVEAMVRDFIDDSEIGPHIRHKAKTIANRLLSFCARYNAGYNPMSAQAGTVEDFTRDATYLFKQYLKQDMFYYEQAIIRVIQKFNLPYANKLFRMTETLRIVELVALLNGSEISAYGNRKNDPLRIVKRLSYLGGSERVKPEGRNVEPTTMGMLQQMLNQFNKSIMTELGLPWHIRYESDDSDQIVRTVESCMKKFESVMTDYEFLLQLFEPDTTLEAAIEESNKRKKYIEDAINKEFHAGGVDKVNNSKEDGN